MVTIDSGIQWRSVFNILKKTDFQFEVLYLAKLSMQGQTRKVSKSLLPMTFLRQLLENVLPETKGVDQEKES